MIIFNSEFKWELVTDFIYESVSDAYAHAKKLRQN